jgi:hypothetical protein
VATDAAAKKQARTTEQTEPSRAEGGGRVDPGALPRPRWTLLKPRTKRLVMGPVVVCVRAGPTATHVLIIRYRPTYSHLT